jgi:hypothetical protein
MTTKRKILTIVFLILFCFGGFVALTGKFAGVFVYWFFLGVVFTALWFLLGPDSRTAGTAPSIPAHVVPENVQERLHRLSKVSPLSIVSFVIFGCFVPSAIYGHNPFGVIIGFVFGAAAFRAWCGRCAVRIILKRQSLEDYALGVHLPALWSYAWRSCVTFVPIAIVLGFASSENADQAGRTAGAVVGMWLVPSILVVDVPYWVRRSVESIVQRGPLGGGRRSDMGLRPKIRYDCFDDLIANLRAAGHNDTARRLHHLLHQVPWTSGTELISELGSEILAFKQSAPEVKGELKRSLSHCIGTIKQVWPDIEGT